MNTIQSVAGNCRRDVSPDAPAPGHQLGVVSFTVNGVSYYLIVTEGGDRNAVSFQGIRTEFKDGSARSSLLNFNINGPFVDLVKNLPRDFRIFGLNGRVRQDDSDDFVDLGGSARIVPVAIHSCDGMSPHGALIYLDNLEGCDAVVVTLADFFEGLSFLTAVVIVVAVVVVAVAAPQVITALKSGKGEMSIDVNVPEGTVDASASFETAPVTSPATAPINSGTAIIDSSTQFGGQ